MPVRPALVVLLVASAAHSQQPAPPPRAVPAPAPVRVREPPPPRDYRLDNLGFPLPPGAVARLGVPPALSGFAWSVAWTADGRQIVAADWSGITLLDPTTGRPIEVQALAEAGRHLWAPPAQNGRVFVRVAGRAGALYDTASGADILAFRLPAPFAEVDRRVYSVCPSADHRFLAGVSAPAAGPGVAWRYDLARGRFARLIGDRADLHTLRLAPDARRVYATAGTRDPELTARDVATDRELWTVRLKGVGTLRALAAGGRRLAVADSTGVTVFDAADGRTLLTAALDSTTPPGLWGVDLAPDGSRLAIADGGPVQVWDVDSGKVRHRLGHNARLVAFAPDGRSLLTASAWVQRWDLETGKPAYPAPFLDKPVGPSLVRWSGDGKRLLTVWPGHRRGESDWRPGPLAVWDVERAEMVWRGASEGIVLSAHLDRDGKTVRAFAGDGTLRVWPPGGATDTWPVNDLSGGSGWLFATFLPDGRLVVQGYTPVEANLGVYGPGRQVVRPPPYRWPTPAHRRETLGYGIGTTVMRPSGSRVDLLTGRPLPPLRGPEPTHRAILEPTHTPPHFLLARISTDSRLPGHLYLWEAVTGRPIAPMPLPMMPETSALSADGRLLAYTDPWNHVVVHDSHDADTAHVLDAGATSALAFSPDGRRLATAHTDGTVLIWDVPRARLGWGTSDPDRLWADLASDDAGRAWRTIWLLLDNPDRALRLLRDRVRPVAADNDTPNLIARLDHPKYAVREEAARRLAGLGERVEGELAEAHRKAGSAEQRQRLEQLLGKLDPAVPPAGEALRGLRAVWLLERIETADAKRVLAAVAGGATGSRVTAEAKAALGRLP